MRCVGVVLVTVAIAGCAPAPERPRWRADCVPRVHTAPLSLEAARDAHRLAAERHEMRLREAAVPGTFLRDAVAMLAPDRLTGAALCPDDVADLGRKLFEHEFGRVDGLGGGQPTPRGPFRRIHAGLFGGPETIGCPSCHWVGGPNGAGAETDNAYLQGDGETIASGDARNPPALVGLGVVEALAREMTSELQGQRDAFMRGAAGEQPLVAKGVSFGVLRRATDGTLDAGGVRGVDADLVVKPFGWKGTSATIGGFSAEALQVHMGIQSAALLAVAGPDAVGSHDDRADPDADGHRDEFPAGPFAALVLHLALVEMPTVEALVLDRAIEPAATALLAPTTTSFANDFQRGRRHFHALGCAGCHTPMLVLRDPVLRVDGLPPVDLSTTMAAPALRYDAALDGYPVWLFSDLRRHDMGPANAARHVQNGVAVREYLTPRLWGVADSLPYLHDGRAPSFDYAIAGHDGEGAAARNAYAALEREDKGALRVYLMSLRRASRVVVP